jgi:photosystem II stability/assembly factor-like uncharacterized protein
MNNMKKLALLLFTLHSLLFTVHCSLAQQYGWIDLSANIPDSNMVNKNLSDICFIGQEGWIAGSYDVAKVYYTPDGGQTFISQSLPANSGNVAMSICMRTPQDGYLVTNTGRVLHTADGGNQWITIATGLGLLYSISFPPLPDTSGYICAGFGGKVCRVTGNTITIEFTTPATLTSVVFPVNSTEGWVCGGTVIRHRNSTGWVIGDQNYSTAQWYNAIHFADNQNGWAVGVPQYNSTGTIIHTINGFDWVFQNDPDSNNLMDVFFLNPQEGWAVGDKVILHTTDSGVNWIEEDESLTDSASFNSVFALNSHEVYVTGQKYFGNNQYQALLLKYALIGGIEDDLAPSQMLMLQNQPNPFSESTVISWQIPAGSWQLAVGSHATLKIFDFLGKEIRTLVDADLGPGEHKVVFDASGRPAGVYFYQLQVNGVIETKKMLICK